MARHELSWMDDRVHNETVQGLRDAWRPNQQHSDDRTPDWTGMTPAEAQEGHALQERLSSLLDRAAGEDEAALTAALAANGDLEADELEMALARRTGTDMLAALAISCELRRRVPSSAFIHVIRGPARRTDLIVTPHGGEVAINVPLSQGARWHDGTLTLARVFPNTFQIAVQDKPLAQVVSHPLLDQHALTITGTEILNGRETRLLTDYVRRPRPIAEFARDELASDETAIDTPPPRRAGTSGGGFHSPF